MSSFFLLHFLLCLCLAFIAVWFANHLQKKFAQAYLSAFLYYVIAAAVYGFLNWLGPGLMVQVLSGHLTKKQMLDVASLLSLLAFPVLLVKIYYLFGLTAAILEKTFSPLFKRVFTVISLAFFMIYAVSVKLYFDSGSRNWMLRITAIAGGLAVIAQVTIVMYLFFAGKCMAENQKRSAARTFAMVILAGFLLYVLFSYSLIFTDATWIVHAVPLLYFLVPLPPLAYLWRFLGKYYLRHPLLPATEKDLARFAESYRLSERESEIIRLLLNGKSKNEIAEQLFLSPHTVRNHMASIYKKVKVKSKLQLSYLVRNFFK
jgi:DNA-binding CsgD family transcriptional regulator